MIYIVLFASAFTSTNRIGWEESRPLEWTDYEGVPDYEDEFRDAVTASALKFITRCHKEDGRLEVIINAEFVKDQSWVKEVARSDYHLNHERSHFDITELFARKFRKFIEDHSYTCEDRDLVQDLIYESLSECMEYQNEYDKGTGYSLLKHRQMIWETKIDSQLQELSAYASE